MGKKLLILLFLSAHFSGWSQGLTISAKVVDRENNEPLGYASIGLKSIAIGTITNEQGEFDFHMPSEYRNEVMVISMLGYKNFEAPVWAMITQSQVIKLEKSPIVLEEVIVSDTLSGEDIMEIALSRIEKNYPMQSFRMDGFYRDVKKIGGIYISLLEAAVRIYDDNYAEPRNKYKLRERVRLIEVRQSLGYESKFTTYFDQENLLEDLLLHNNVRYRHFENEGNVFPSMIREKNSFYDEHETYVISYHGDYFLKLYIDKEDFSIIHLESQQGMDQDYLGKRKNLVSKFAGIKKKLDFRKFQGKMYPSFMSITSKINWYDSETKVLKFETELFQQLLINKITPNTKERIKSTEKMRNYGLQFQDEPYNKQFWDNYNVIKETPLDEKIIEDLEKHSPLNQQFEDN